MVVMLLLKNEINKILCNPFTFAETLTCNFTSPTNYDIIVIFLIYCSFKKQRKQCRRKDKDRRCDL